MIEKLTTYPKIDINAKIIGEYCPSNREITKKVNELIDFANLQNKEEDCEEVEINYNVPVPAHKVLPAIQEDLDKLTERIMDIYPDKWCELKIIFHREQGRKPSYIFSAETKPEIFTTESPK